MPRIKLVASAVLIALASLSLTGQADGQDGVLAPAVTLSPSSVTNGHVILVEIDSHRDSTAVQLMYKDRFIPLSEHPTRAGGHYFALIGIPYYSAPGAAQLMVKWSGMDGFAEKKVPFRITTGKYRSERLKVKPGKVSPSKPNLERIRVERQKIKTVYAERHLTRLWTAPFQKPIQSVVTSPFGSKRLFNGKTKSYHSGLDFRAAVGTPIYAANAGIVKMGQDLFYSGNIIIIDHGMGLFTNYAHLSRMDVTPGQFVARGEQIGLAGATGRVNGPHLHWGAKVNGSTVNPMDLIERLTVLFDQSRTRSAQEKSIKP